MNVTKNEIKNRKLHKEDYRQRVSAEQKEYAEVFAHSRITENNHIIADLKTDNLMEKILDRNNLNQAYKKVKANKGAGGVDGMNVDELLTFLKENKSDLIQKIKDGKYKPNPVRRVEIPKEEKGEVRKLGKTVFKSKPRENRSGTYQQSEVFRLHILPLSRKMQAKSAPKICCENESKTKRINSKKQRVGKQI